jgi:poly(3-hydroxybutyrate) depolymerase
MLYALHEMQRALLSPYTYLAEAGSRIFSEAGSLYSHLPGASHLAAEFELAYRIGKDYEKPEFELARLRAHNAEIAILQRTVIETPFCRLLRFKRFSDDANCINALKDDPTVLVVAPLSGHHSTLLRDTVRTLLADHKVYITDWTDARMVPTSEGNFSLNDYIDTICTFIRHIGARKLHVISVCQPTVPVLAAVSLMASRGEDTPLSLTMMGGPIDPRKNPTQVNSLAATKPLSWFSTNLIHRVPPNYPGNGRRVYPGFLQHAGFIAMNPDRHFQSHWEFYQDLVRGDQDDAESHRRFYNEYNAVLDMDAEYYLDTIETVFQKHLLPKGEWFVHDERVAPEAIRHSALMTIEGELDDISGLGQTEAAQALCRGIPKSAKKHMVVEGAGHYGIFSGRRWREQVYPKVREFIRAHQPASPSAATPAARSRRNPR